MGLLADDDSSGRGGGLETRRGVHHVAEREGLAGLGSRRQRDDGLTGVHSAPRLEIETRSLPVQVLE